MAILLYCTWAAMTALRYGGVLTIFAGVALFGVYFIAGNARAARQGDSAVPASSWRGAGPRQGIRIFVIGAAMLLAAYVLSLLMPNGS